MNTIKEILVASCLVLSLGAISNITVAAVTNTGVTQHINNTNTHLEAALSAVNANDLEEAQKNINAARQASKGITGSTLAPKVSRGSDVIVKARRYIKEGDTKEATAAIKEALEIFNSMISHLPSKADSSSQGGL